MGVMMKAVSTVTALIALSAFANSASATIIEDITTFTPYGTQSPLDLDSYGGKYVNKLEGTGDWVAWTHHFDFGGGPVKINSANLAVTLEDDSSTDWIELAFGLAENGDWDIGLVSSATYTYDLAVQSLYDGSFSINLVDLFGDFVIKASLLRIDYTSVPEPATLSLMGLGLLGAALGCRRRKRIKSN